MTGTVRRFSWAALLGVSGLALAWTVIILSVPQVRFATPFPRLRIALEAAAMVVVAIIAALAYVRYSLTGAGTWLAISVAFLVLGMNQLVFGLAVPPDAIPARLAVYFWNVGRILVGTILLAGAFQLRRPPVARNRLRRFLALAASSLATLGIIEVLLWAIRDSLPPLTTAPGALVRGATGALPGLTPMVVGMGAAGSLLFLTAALVFMRDMDREGSSPWLPPALVLGAVSHLHYTLFPTRFTDLISTGDLLRLAFSAVLLAGVVWEIHRSSAAERARALELDAAYRAERERARQLEEVDRSREELFSILTHELMHPVAGIRGTLVTLVGRWDELDETVKRELLARGEEESGRLRNLAEEAATALQLEDASFRIHPRDLSVTDLVSEAAEAADDRLEGRLIVRMDVGAETATVWADRPRVLQVMRNLLSNAAKFSPAGSRVELRAAPEDANVRLSVVDEGPGVDPEQVPRLFQSFSRLPTVSDEIRGSGLGLYISRRIVEAHGGRIWHEPANAGGSAFCFTLPGVRS